jgi:hypothetical protein
LDGCRYPLGRCCCLCHPLGDDGLGFMFLQVQKSGRLAAFLYLTLIHQTKRSTPPM